MGVYLPTVMESSCENIVDTRFGKFPKGCVLSYQQKLPSEFVLNLMDTDSFPDLPLANNMVNNVHIVLNEMQTKYYESLLVTVVESIEIENNTRIRCHQINQNGTKS